MNDFNQQLALVGAATSYSDVYQLPADVGHVEASAVVSAIAGTTPTLIVTVQTSQDKVTWEDRNVLPTFAATGTKKVRASEPRIYFRFKLVLAGTTPTATVTLFAIGREGEGDSSEMLILQDAAGATGNGNVLDVVGQASAVIAITGTFSATVTFEGTLDGTNWFAVNATKVGDGGVASTATTTGLYRIACASITSLRARVSTWASGALTATGRTTQNDSGSYDNIPRSVFYTTPGTRTNGQGGPLLSDALGNLLATLKTYIEGEDPTFRVLKTQVRATYTPPITASGLIFTGPGQFMGYIVNSCGAGATVKVWDSLTGATTVVMDTATFTAAEAQGPKPVVLPVAVQLGTGCYITITGTISLTPLWNQ